MATEQTAEAIINTGNLSPEQAANISVVEANGTTVVANSGTVSDLAVEAKPGGTVVVEGGTYQNLVFTFAGTGASAVVANTSAVNALIQAAEKNSTESLKIGSKADEGTTETTGTTTKLKQGDDTVRFGGNTVDSNSTYGLGKGADSVRFAANAQITNAVINLGNDSNADVIDIRGSGDNTSAVLRKFGREDTLKVGGETYTYDQIQNLGGQIGNIRVELLP